MHGRGRCGLDGACGTGRCAVFPSTAACARQGTNRQQPARFPGGRHAPVWQTWQRFVERLLAIASPWRRIVGFVHPSVMCVVLSAVLRALPSRVRPRGCVQVAGGGRLPGQCVARCTAMVPAICRRVLMARGSAVVDSAARIEKPGFGAAPLGSCCRRGSCGDDVDAARLVRRR